MPTWLITLLTTVAVTLGAIALFFFTLTRGALLLRAVSGDNRDAAAHVYPIYSNMRLIQLVDWQPIIAAILLFQYDRLVTEIAHGLSRSDLRRQRALITSCAFGNVIPRVCHAAIEAGAERVQIVDIIRNELQHAQGKLPGLGERLEFLQENATAMSLADGSVAANVLFFLLHELPHPLKAEVLREAVRVLAPGGKLYIAEFHRPSAWLLRASGWLYFKVFEPYGLALWDREDPLRALQAMGLSCERRTVFFGNFQVIVATRA